MLSPHMAGPKTIDKYQTSRVVDNRQVADVGGQIFMRAPTMDRRKTLHTIKEVWVLVVHAGHDYMEQQYCPCHQNEIKSYDHHIRERIMCSFKEI